MPAGRLLVVTPLQDLRQSLAFALEAHGFGVTSLETLSLRSWTRASDFHCVVLDWTALKGSATIPMPIKALSVVLLAESPPESAPGWVSSAVEVPILGNALIDAVRTARQKALETLPV